MASPPAQNNDPQPHKYLRPFLVVMMLCSLFLGFQILRPFLNPIILGSVLAAIFFPLHNRFLRFWNGRHNVASMTTMLFIFLVIVLPVLLLSFALVDQGGNVVSQITHWVNEGGLDRVLQSDRVLRFQQWLSNQFPDINFTKQGIEATVVESIKRFSSLFIKHGADALGNMAGLLASFFVMMFVIFYFVRDGKDMVDWVKHLSPLRDDQEDRIIERIRSVSRSVLVGSFLTAVVQGIVGSIGLTIVGIPAIFLGTMIGFTSLIPVIGSALVSLPVIGYLLLIGSWKSALFFGLWGGVLFSCIDQFLRPFLMKGQAGMSPFYIFLAVMGGVQVFGFVGILYGPLIIAFAMVMLYIYEEEFRYTLTPTDSPPPETETPEESPAPETAGTEDDTKTAPGSETEADQDGEQAPA